MNGSSKRLTLIDLFAAACLCIFLIATLVPAAGILDTRATRIKCASNLKNIAAAMVTYANNNNGKYPRTYWEFRSPEKLTAYSAVKAKDPFGADGPGPGDLTAPIYLLIRATGVDPDIFICPATDGKPLHFGKAAGDIAANATDISNFPAEENLGYSMNNPYAGQSAIVTQWVWDSTLSEDFALFADMNPGGKAVAEVKYTSTREEMQKANSPNHKGAGQNVLYGDYHVAFQISPFCGPQNEKKIADNIYTRSPQNNVTPAEKVDLKGEPIIGPATDSLDSVLLPPVGYKPLAAKK